MLPRGSHLLDIWGTEAWLGAGVGDAPGRDQTLAAPDIRPHLCCPLPGASRV